MRENVIREAGSGRTGLLMSLRRKKNYIDQFEQQNIEMVSEIG